MSKTEKIYCYVDESGQDTKGNLFVVVAVVIVENISEVQASLEKIEASITKRKFKWNKMRPADKVEYIKRCYALKQLKGKVYFHHFQNSKSYKSHTVATIAEAITLYIKKQLIIDYKTLVTIDGLGTSEQKKMSTAMRALGIRISKVRGEKDENNALIRLADMTAGFIREVIEGNNIFDAIKKDLDRRHIFM